MLYDKYPKSKEIGKRVKECRQLFKTKNHPLSQANFYMMLTGEKALVQTDIDNYRQIVRRWEAGETLPPIKIIDKMCDLSGWESDYFLCRIDGHTHVKSWIFELTGLKEFQIGLLAGLSSVSSFPNSIDYISIINDILISQKIIGLIGNLDNFISSIRPSEIDNCLSSTKESDCYEYRALQIFREMIYEIAEKRIFGKDPVLLRIRESYPEKMQNSSSEISGENAK